ncbi:SRPBCC family protein [Metabacillus litoralis]|uniref:SRPBCC family protein n=1 Tax=Metabacillus litoralis TaxID=152268 RepID=A0A5C6W5L9_9BACI|nr:SRPBCC family protein [Metabacillus litoralis]TXC93101.1 SRPBCC family protein [Metabacillus litoralis]
MPSELHQIRVKLPIHSIWNFVSVMDHWAPLVPGYIDHETLNSTDSIWKFKSDFGLIKKKVELRVEITSWEEPNKVTFNLLGINEKISGHGYFLAEEINSEETMMNGFLDLSSEAAMSKMINAKLKKNIKEMTQDLTTAIATRIQELEEVK